jgi:hypothetical protein
VVERIVTPRNFIVNIDFASVDNELLGVTICLSLARFTRSIVYYVLICRSLFVLLCLFAHCVDWSSFIYEFTTFVVFKLFVNVVGNAPRNFIVNIDFASVDNELLGVTICSTTLSAMCYLYNASW